MSVLGKIVFSNFTYIDGVYCVCSNMILKTPVLSFDHILNLGVVGAFAPPNRFKIIAGAFKTSADLLI